MSSRLNLFKPRLKKPQILRFIDHFQSFDFLSFIKDPGSGSFSDMGFVSLVGCKCVVVSRNNTRRAAWLAAIVFVVSVTCIANHASILKIG